MRSKPGLFATDCWKKTARGSAIRLEASRSLALLNRPILLIGGVHGDEPEGVELATRATEWLRQHSEHELAPWVSIPCLNVDGFAAGERVNSNGVDINRNYPASDWSPDYSKPRYFPGPTAASELETQAVVELICQTQPRLIIHCHSWEPCIVFTGAPARADADRLAASSGYVARESIGYPTPGSLSSYAWDDGVAPVICIEERDGLPAEARAAIWTRFAAGFAEIFRDRSMRLSRRAGAGES